MEFKGRVNKKSYTGRELRCECHFIRGFGWDTKDNKRYNLDGPDKCKKRKKAVQLRHLELREEYLRKFNAGDNLIELRKFMHEIVYDLIEKVRAGEFLEDGNGAHFWGGYFYLQTLVAIVDPSMNFWQVGDSLVKEKKISLEGAVVQDYHEPPPPKWKEYTRCDYKGFIGIALLPAHSEMPQVWKLEVLDQNGKTVSTGGMALLYAPTFGPDVSDVENMKKTMDQFIQEAVQRKKK